MRKPIIQKLIGREILDSRGNPTLEVATILCDGTVGLCAVPAGASRGQYEAIERRDGDPARYGGLGVTAAARSVREIFSPLLCGMNAAENQRIDRRLLAADGTAQKEKYGGNTLLGVSLSVARAAAAFYRLPLYRYLGGAAARRLPVPMMNLINGGAHAANRLDIQEFMVVPVGAPSFREALRWGSEIRRALGKLLSDAGYATGVGDEGGFAPDLPDERAALDFLMAAVAAAGYENKGVKIALDIASSEWTAEDGLYHLPKEGSSLTREALTARLSALIADYPILSLEDPLGEEDFEGWAGLTGTLGDRVTLVGDDLFCDRPRAARPRNPDRGGQRRAGQAESERHPFRHALFCGKGPKSRIPGDSFAPFGRDRGHDRGRSGRGRGRALYQGGGALPGRTGGQIQPAFAH